MHGPAAHHCSSSAHKETEYGWPLAALRRPGSHTGAGTALASLGWPGAARGRCRVGTRVRQVRPQEHQQSLPPPPTSAAARRATLARPPQARLCSPLRGAPAARAARLHVVLESLCWARQASCSPRCRAATAGCSPSPWLGCGDAIRRPSSSGPEVRCALAQSSCFFDSVRHRPASWRQSVLLSPYRGPRQLAPGADLRFVLCLQAHEDRGRGLSHHQGGLPFAPLLHLSSLPRTQRMALLGQQEVQARSARNSPHARHQEWECSSYGASKYLTRLWCRMCWQPPVTQRPDAPADEDDEDWGPWSSRAAPSGSATAIGGLACYDAIFSEGVLPGGGTTPVVPHPDQAEDAPSGATPSPPRPTDRARPGRCTRRPQSPRPQLSLRAPHALRRSLLRCPRRLAGRPADAMHYAVCHSQDRSRCSASAIIF